MFSFVDGQIENSFRVTLPSMTMLPRTTAVKDAVEVG
jgi:hypothetical protein